MFTFTKQQEKELQYVFSGISKSGAQQKRWTNKLLVIIYVPHFHGVIKTCN